MVGSQPQRFSPSGFLPHPPSADPPSDHPPSASSRPRRTVWSDHGPSLETPTTLDTSSEPTDSDSSPGSDTSPFHHTAQRPGGYGSPSVPLELLDGFRDTLDINGVDVQHRSKKDAPAVQD